MQEGDPIYLDNHATTRCDPRVVEAMLPYFSGEYGNPHSRKHEVGRQAAKVVEESIQSLCSVLNASPDEWIVTSGATESNNLAIFGVLTHPLQRRRHLVTVATEHPSVLDPVRQARKLGFEVTEVGVLPQGDACAGQVDLEAMERAIRDDTALVSVMLANNEIGTLQPIEKIVPLCRRRGALFHTDAVQAVGRIPVDVRQLDVDLLSLSAHKFYGPKGVGALFVRHGTPRVRLAPLIVGGGQQHGLRSGTMNVAGIVGMAAALRLAASEMPSEGPRIRQLRDRLWEGLGKGIEGIECNGPRLDPDVRLSSNLNVCLPCVEGESVMMAVPRLAVSSGSACSSAEPTPSHVLLALNRSESEARRSLRLGIGRFNREEEIDTVIELLTEAYHRLSRLL